MLEWFKARTEWNDGLQSLSDEQAGRFAKALWNYMSTGEETTLSGIENVMFAIALGYQKREAEKRSNVSAVRSEVGKMGGRPKKANETNCFFEKQNEAKKADKEPEKEPEKDTTTTTTLPHSFPSFNENGAGSSEDDYYVSSNIPGMTKCHWEEMRKYIDNGMEMGVILYAVNEAVAHGTPTWAYVRSILNRCRNQDIRTRKQAEATIAAKADNRKAEEYVPKYKFFNKADFF